MTLEETLVSLVDIPSVTGAEGRLCTALAQRLLPVYDMDGVSRIGNSLVVGRRTGRPILALVGHIDTVPEQGNGTARIADGMVYGLGTSDMKGGVAVMVHLLEDELVRASDFDVVGVFYDKEEGSMADNGLEPVLDAVPWLEEAEFAVVLEPTDLELQLGCNGSLNARITFMGSSAHSARPWLGSNAITRAGAWLDEMHRREPQPVTVAGLEFLEVFSVTKAGGGIAHNVIPPRFDLNLNYRFPPIYSMEDAARRVAEVAAAADDVEVIDAAPSGEIAEDNPHLQRLATVSGAERTAKQAWTDVARLTSRGIAAVNYGPGLVAQAHQVGEHVPIANLEACYTTLRRFLTEP